MSLADEIAAASPPDPRTISAIASLLERNGIDVAEIGRVQRVNLWQAMSKGDDGVPEVTDLVGVQLSPAWEEGPRWPLVAPAAPCVVRPVAKLRKSLRSALQTAVILPDAQIGYRRDIDTGELDPFHDESAMACALTILRSVNPDLVIILGDLVDLPSFGRFEQEAGFALTTQAALDRAHRFLAEAKANAPNAEVRLIEGNHDRRLQKAITNNAVAAFGLRRANVPESWPVLSMPFLLRLDELGVEYVEGYPAGWTPINERLWCVHGERLKLEQVVDDERVSVIQGHTHRAGVTYRTRRGPRGPRTIMAASPGTLARTDGAVPSTKSSTDSRGRMVPRQEPWEQGLAVVHYEPGDGPFEYHPVLIHDGQAIYHGRAFGGESC